MRNERAKMKTPLGLLNRDPIASVRCLQPCGDRPEESSSIPGGHSRSSDGLPPATLPSWRSRCPKLFHFSQRPCNQPLTRGTSQGAEDSCAGTPGPWVLGFTPGRLCGFASSCSSSPWPCAGMGLLCLPLGTHGSGSQSVSSMFLTSFEHLLC